jgi:antitoxin component of MazEF toxin-antitoxin module
MKVKVRQIGTRYTIALPKKIVERLSVNDDSELVISATDSGVLLSPVDREFADQLVAFRRIEPKHRKSFRELVK